MTWQFTLTGLLIGSLVGLTGMGGGSLMTPILVLVFGFKPTYAVGTDIRTCQQVIDGISITPRLNPRIDFLSGFAIARAQIAMVVKQNS